MAKVNEKTAVDAIDTDVVTEILTAAAGGTKAQEDSNEYRWLKEAGYFVSTARTAILTAKGHDLACAIQANDGEFLTSVLNTLNEKDRPLTLPLLERFLDAYSQQVVDKWVDSQTTGEA